jgi:hypothetical protein
MNSERLTESWRHQGHTLSGALAGLISLILAGCGNSDSNMVQTTETLKSWTETIDFLAQQWTEHRVPEIYVRQMLKAGNEALTKEQKRIGDVSSKAPAKAEEARAAASYFQSRIHRLEKKLTKEPNDPSS